jgi:hypothetical protein
MSLWLLWMSASLRGGENRTVIQSVCLQEVGCRFCVKTQARTSKVYLGSHYLHDSPVDALMFLSSVQTLRAMAAELRTLLRSVEVSGFFWTRSKRGVVQARISPLRTPGCAKDFSNVLRAKCITCIGNYYLKGGLREDGRGG